MITRNRTPLKYGSMVCICIFQACRLGGRLKDYPVCSRETIHVSIWNWIQKHKPQRTSYSRRKIAEYNVDEALIKIGSEHIWLWVAIGPIDREILALTISKERDMFVAERFISGLVQIYGGHPVSADGGTWYPQACGFLRTKHHIHSPFEKEPCSTSRTEPNVSMTIFHVEKRDVN